MPVCKKCHNYVTGKLEQGHPCPHCGNEDTLEDRSEGEYRSIFEDSIQQDFNQPYDYNANYTPNTNNSSFKLYTDLPLEFLFPSGVNGATLPITEQKVYLQLSLEFMIILNRSQDYQEGMRNWNSVLPERLHAYGLSREVWDRISFAGDRDEKLQEQIRIIVKKIF